MKEIFLPSTESSSSSAIWNETGLTGMLATGSTNVHAACHVKLRHCNNKTHPALNQFN
jgi:hypothetical protein